MADDRFLQRVVAETGLVGNADPVPEAVVADMVARDYGLRGALTRIATEKDDTFRLDTDDRPYLVKISSASEDPAFVDLQTAALVHVESVAPELPVQRLVRTRRGGSSIALRDACGPFPRTLRILTFIPGTLLAGVRPTADQLAKVGAMLAGVATALAGFGHAHDERLLLWDLVHFPRLRGLLDSVRDPAHRKLAGTVVEEFEAGVVPRLGSLRRQVVHGDFSPYNVVVAPDAPGFVTGVIDFGDTVRTATVFDVAVMTANQIGRDEHEPWSSAAAFLRGYHAENPLDEHELATLRVAGMARLALRALVAEWRAEHSPDRYEYLMSHAGDDWLHLEVAAASDPGDVNRLLSACACRAAPPPREDTLS